MDKKTRKPNRLQNRNYAQPGIYFITFCTARRKCLLANAPQIPVDLLDATKIFDHIFQLTPIGEYAERAIQNIPFAYEAVAVEKYVIMPNHIHLLLRIHANEQGIPFNAPSIDTVIRQLKGIISKQADQKLWQRSYYDHIIRNEKDYEETVKYILENPRRWLLDELYSK